MRQRFSLLVQRMQRTCRACHGIIPLLASLSIGATVAVFPLLGVQALQVGDSGSGVEELQVALTNTGFYSGPISGVYGELTQAAVFRYQLDRGLFVDGIAGPNTLSSLGLNDLAAVTSVSSSSSYIEERSKVEDLQRRLQVSGFYDGPIDGEYGAATREAVFSFSDSYLLTIQQVERYLGLNEDGIYTEEIRERIKEFQSQENLTVDGIVGPETRERLVARVAGFEQSIANGGVIPRNTSLCAALRTFQEKNGLVSDCIVGPQTFAILISEIHRSEGPSPSCPPGYEDMTSLPGGIASGSLPNGIGAVCIVDALVEETVWI